MSEFGNTGQDKNIDQSRPGFAFAVSAFTLWGFAPLFMKAVSHIDAIEVMAHRALWSVPIALMVLVATGRTSDMMRVFSSPRKLAILTVSALFISINWGVYVWAIAAERSVEAALGYYINPLFSVALGMVLLGEKLDRLQLFAVGLATLGVVVLTYTSGQIPWVALFLASTFAVYGFIRKTIDIGPTQGFMVEVLILSLAVIPYLVYLNYTGEGHLGRSTYDTLLVLACGPVTAIPLILFSYGAKRLRLSTIGIMQYIAPTLIFLIGVFVFREPFGQNQLISFILIWAAIALYTYSGMKQVRKPSADRL